MSTKAEESKARWDEMERAIKDHPADDLLLVVTPMVYRGFYLLDMRNFGLMFKDTVDGEWPRGGQRHTWITGTTAGGHQVFDDKKVEVIKTMGLAEPGWALKARES